MKSTDALNNLRIVLGLTVMSIVSCAKGGTPIVEVPHSVEDLLTSTQWKILKTQYQKKDSTWTDGVLSLTDKVSIYQLTKEHLRIRKNTITKLQDTVHWQLLSSDKVLQFKDSGGYAFKSYDLKEITPTETIWKDRLSGTVTMADPITGITTQFIGYRIILLHYPQ